MLKLAKSHCIVSCLLIAFTTVARAGDDIELSVGDGLSLKNGKAALVRSGGDVQLVYLEKTLPGFKNHFNNLTGQVETRPVPGRQVATAALTAKRVKVLKEKPDIAKLTTGDITAAEGMAKISTGDKFALLQAGDEQFWLLTITSAKLPPDNAAGQRLTVTAEPIKLARGAAGGMALAKLPGRIVYVDKTGETTDLMSCDLATGERKLIRKNIGTEPRVSRDLSRIAFDSSKDEALSLTIVTAAGKVVRQIDIKGEDLRGWDLSPSGERVAADIFRRDKDGVQERVVLVYNANGKLVCEVPGIRIPAFAGEDRLICAPAVGDGISIVDLKTGEVKAVDTEVFDPMHFVASPDGVSMAFRADEKIHLMRLDGTQKRVVAERDGEIMEQPAFSPDGKYLTYVSINRTLYSLPRPIKLIDLASGDVADLVDAKDSLIHPVFDSTVTWIE